MLNLRLSVSLYYPIHYELHLDISGPPLSFCKIVFHRINAFILKCYSALEIILTEWITVEFFTMLKCFVTHSVPLSIAEADQALQQHLILGALGY